MVKLVLDGLDLGFYLMLERCQLHVGNLLDSGIVTLETVSASCRSRYDFDPPLLVEVGQGKKLDGLGSRPPPELFGRLLSFDRRIARFPSKEGCTPWSNGCILSNTCVYGVAEAR